MIKVTSISYSPKLAFVQINNYLSHFTLTFCKDKGNQTERIIFPNAWKTNVSVRVDGKERN